MRDLEEMRRQVTPEEIEHTKKALAEQRLSKAKAKDSEEEPEPQAEPA